MSNNRPVPNQGQTVVAANGRITQPWLYWFQGFSQPPAAFDSGPWGASPLAFTAPSDGTFLIVNGTGVNASITRGTTTVLVPNSGFIPLTMGDLLNVNWATVPDMTFIPG